MCVWVCVFFFSIFLFVSIDCYCIVDLFHLFFYLPFSLKMRKKCFFSFFFLLQSLSRAHTLACAHVCARALRTLSLPSHHCGSSYSMCWYSFLYRPLLLLRCLCHSSRISFCCLVYQLHLRRRLRVCIRVNSNRQGERLTLCCTQLHERDVINYLHNTNTNASYSRQSDDECKNAHATVDSNAINWGYLWFASNPFYAVALGWWRWWCGYWNSQVNLWPLSMLCEHCIWYISSLSLSVFFYSKQ